MRARPNRRTSSFFMGQHTQSRKRYVHGTPTKCARAPIYGPIRREGMYRTSARIVREKSPRRRESSGKGRQENKGTKSPALARLLGSAPSRSLHLREAGIPQFEIRVHCSWYVPVRIGCNGKSRYINNIILWILPPRSGPASLGKTISFQVPQNSLVF